jgi:hypothetical protein
MSSQKHKVKPAKHVKAPQFDLAQFQIQQRADNSGIYITITYAGHPIHAFLLSIAEYQIWQRMSIDQKFAYMRSLTNSGVFSNNKKIVGLVVKATVNILDEIFARAKAQTQRRMAQ